MRKPDGCRPCPLYQTGEGFVPDEIIEGSEVFILAQNPGADEEAQAKPKVGKVGQEEQANFFPRAGLSRGRVSLGNVLRCRWGGTNTLPPAALLQPATAHCARYLTIPSSTRLIVGEGSVAWKFLGGPGSIKNWRGYLSPHHYQGRPVFGVLHVGDILQHEKKYYFPSQLDWRKIKRFLEGSWPKAAPPCHLWKGDSLLHEWVQAAIRRASIVAIDTEYNPETRVLSLLGMGAGELEAGIQIDSRWEVAAPLVQKLVQSVPVVFQNAFADIPILEHNLGIAYTDYLRIEDTMLEHACLWSELPHDLEFQASLYSPYGKRKHLKHVDQYAYNWGDVIDTLSAHASHQQEFQGDPLSKKVYETQSLPLIPHLLRSMQHGLRINKERVLPAAGEYARRMEEATRIAQAYAGWPLNIGSDDQLGRYLYTMEALPLQKHKKTKRATIEADALAVLRQRIGPPYDPEEEEKNGLSLDDALLRIEEGAHPVLEMRVVYADALQAASHYIRPCFLRDAEGEPIGVAERLYPHFQIHAQASGRWSTIDPPMAQLPKDLRDIVVPDEGEAWIEFDFDQIELRLLAVLCHDTPLLEAFTQGWDIHTLNTCDIFGLPHPPDRSDPHGSPLAEGWRAQVKWEGKDDLRRRFAKRFEYRLNYGGEPRLAGDIPGAKALGLTPQRLVQAANRLLAAHPAKAAWRQRVAEAAMKMPAESRTFMGRKRVLLSRDAGLRKREAFNHPLQGGVRDIANVVFLQIANEFPYLRFAFEMHDSQKWACPIDKVEATLPRVKEIVEQPFDVHGEKVSFPATFHVLGV